MAYPTIDLKMRNPFPFPVAVRAVAHKGTLVVSLHGKQRPARVSLATATVGVKPYKRKIRQAPWLTEGRIVRKQAGRRGVTIRKVRHIKYSDGKELDEKTIDTYPPTTEIYLVPPGTDPDELPQMPEDAAAG